MIQAYITELSITINQKTDIKIYIIESLILLIYKMIIIDFLLEDYLEKL